MNFPQFIHDSPAYVELSQLGLPPRMITSLLPPHATHDWDNTTNLVEAIRTLRYWQVSSMPHIVCALALTTSEMHTVIAEFGRHDPYVHRCAMLNLNPCCIQMASHGYIDCLTYLHSIGFQCGEMAMISAVKNDHVDCAEFMVRQNCPWDIEDVGRIASVHGSIKCLRWLRSMGHPFEQYMLINALLHGYITCVRELDSIIFTHDTLLTLNAARGGSIECIEYLCSKNVSWHESAATVLAQRGNTIGLEIALSGSYPADPLLCDFAAGASQTECVRIAVSHGYSISGTTLCAAASNGSIECVQYLINMGCTSVNACSAAASRGHISVLMVLKGSGYTFNENLCTVAAARNQIACIEYLFAEECPRNCDRLCTVAINDNNLGLLMRLIELGCTISNKVRQYAQSTDSTECIDHIMNMK